MDYDKYYKPYSLIQNKKSYKYMIVQPKKWLYLCRVN